MAIELSNEIKSSIIIKLLFFAQARDLVGTSRTQISLILALDESMIFLSNFQILQKLRFQCLYFGIFFLHASLRKLKLIIFWLVIMFIFILLIWLYLWFPFEWTRRCVCAGAEWAVCGGPGVSAGPCFSFPQCALALRRWTCSHSARVWRLIARHTHTQLNVFFAQGIISLLLRRAMCFYFL